MLLVFVHGWGVRHPDYGTLPALLRDALGAESVEIRLSEYVSYADTVTLEDLADAFERIRRARFPDRNFACVAHSTGGPVMRVWLDRHRGPMTHLIMLAPPNHGSALAQLGKGRVSRLKCWAEGVEPGQRILDWLELGSPESWDLNLRWLRARSPVRIAVITGDAPDRRLYDHLNSYTGEAGSDGVVRVPSANLNYSYLHLRQHGSRLVAAGQLTSTPAPLFIAARTSHRSILNSGHQPLSAPRQTTAMAVFRIRDTAGAPVEDFDLLLTAGPAYDPDALPHGFFIDRQRNSVAPHHLTYYFNYHVLAGLKEFGFRLQPRPAAGPVYYGPAEFRGRMYLSAHQTAMIDVELERRFAPELFRLS